MTLLPLVTATYDVMNSCEEFVDCQAEVHRSPSLNTPDLRSLDLFFLLLTVLE